MENDHFFYSPNREPVNPGPLNPKPDETLNPPGFESRSSLRRTGVDSEGKQPQEQA